MSKAVLMSIRPEWCRMILSGRKTAEVRKSYPKAKDLPYPFKVYIYRTNEKDRLIDIVKDGDEINWFLNPGEEPVIYHGKTDFIKAPGLKGAVVAEFDCCCIESLANHSPNAAYGYHQPFSGCTCVSTKELYDYGLTTNKGYREIFSWHIDNLKQYDKPLKLSAFGLKRPPISWQYVEELQQGGDA